MAKKRINSPARKAKAGQEAAGSGIHITQIYKITIRMSNV